MGRSILGGGRERRRGVRPKLKSPLSGTAHCAPIISGDWRREELAAAGNAVYPCTEGGGSRRGTGRRVRHSSNPPPSSINLLYRMKVEDKTLFLQIFDSPLAPRPLPPVPALSVPAPAPPPQPLPFTPRPSLLRLPAALLADALPIYEWREATDYPIARCGWRAVRFAEGRVREREEALLRASLRPWEEVVVEVETEWLQPLAALAPLTLPQLLHCFKQALVGFERLFTLFGGFKVQPQMVCVDAHGRPKVWLSLALDHNTKVQCDNSSHGEADLVATLRQFFSALASDTATTRLLFANLAECSSFLALFRQLDSFTDQHKLLPARLLAPQRPSRPRSPPPPRPHHPRIPRFLSPGRSDSPSRKRSPDSWKAGEGRLLWPADCAQKKQGRGGKTSDICSEDTSVPVENLVRIDKARKGSGSNFIFKSAGTLSAAHQQLARKHKNSEISAPPSHVQSLPLACDPADSLLQNFQRLFEEEPTDYLSVSISLEEQQLWRKRHPDRLKHYGREVSDSIISAPRPA